jgi:DNA-binding NarL/FixJ family response regulator
MHATTQAGRIGVTIVEDSRATMDAFVGALGSDPRVAVVATASTATAAAASLSSECPDVLLVDLGLPDGSGVDVIRLARRMCPKCEVMVVTVFGDEQNVFRSIEAGATGYVLKDISPEMLVDTVVHLHAGGAPMTPGIARMLLNRLQAAGSARLPSNLGAPVTLTPREVDVLSALSRGYTYAEIAAQLQISLHTVTTHIKSSYRKLEVHSGAAAVTRAAELGLLVRSSDDP